MREIKLKLKVTPKANPTKLNKLSKFAEHSENLMDFTIMKKCARLRYLLVGCLAILLVGPISGCATKAKKPEQAQVFGTRAIELPNGLRAFLVSDPAVHDRSALALSVGVGLTMDPPSQPGLAHYLEHMLLLGGSAKFPQPGSLMTFVESNAGIIGARTDQLTTSYYFEASNEQLPRSMAMFGDMLEVPLFNPEISQKELTNLDSEWRMLADDEGFNIAATQFINLNPGHPFSGNISVGNLQTLTDKPGSNLHDELHRFYKTYYSANVMTLAMESNLSLDDMEARIKKYFSGLKNRNINIPESSIAGLSGGALRRHIYYRALSNIHRLYIDFPLTFNKEQWDDKTSVYVGNLLLSDGDGALKDFLRTQGWANGVSVSANPRAFGSSGVLTINVQLSALGVNYENEVIAAVFKAIEQLKSGGITSAYYEEVKAQEARDVNARGIGLLGKVQLFSAQIPYVPAAHQLDSQTIFPPFSAKPIENLLASMTPSNAVIWHVGPQQQADTPIPYFKAHFRVAEITASEQANWLAMGRDMPVKLPSKNGVTTPQATALVQEKNQHPVLIRDTPQAQVWLANATTNVNDQGFIYLIWETSEGRRTAKEYVLGCLLHDIYDLADTKLHQQLMRNGQSAMYWRNADNNEMIKLQGASGSHKDVMPQLVKNFNALKFDEAMFVKVNSRFQEWVNDWDNMQSLERGLSVLEGEGPIPSVFPQQDLLAASRQMTVEELRAYHRQLLANHRLRVFAFGNYTRAETLAWVDAVTAHVKPTHAKHSAQPAVGINDITAGPGLIVKAGESQEFSLASKRGDSANVAAYIYPEFSPTVSAHFAVLATLLNPEFFAQLRTSRQLGYDVRALHYRLDRGNPVFVMGIQSGKVSPAILQEEILAFSQRFLPVLKNMPDESIEVVKNAIYAGREDLSNFSAETNRLLPDFVRDSQTFDGRNAELLALKAVTKESLVNVYRSVILGEPNVDAMPPAFKVRVVVNGRN